MYYKLIEQNIYKLSSNITKSFLEKNGIYVNEEESIFLTNIVKENWEDLYNNNYENECKLISKELNQNKVKLLFNLYQTKINQYLN